MKKNQIYVGISIVIMALFKMAPAFGGLTDQGLTAIGLVVALVFLMATQALPTGVMCFLCIIAQPLLGLTGSLTESTNYWASYLFFFVMMAFVIGISVANTTIPRRLLFFMLRHARQNARGPIVAIWLTTALLSGIIANFATIALMLAFCWEYLDLFDNEEDRKATGRCLLIGMCAATELGGNITPLGSSINVMVMGFLEQSGHPVSYLQWIGISLPLFVVLFFLMTKILFFACRPRALSPEKFKLCQQQAAVEGSLSAKEKRLVALLSFMMFCLLISPVVPAFKNEIIIVLAGVVLMLPGLDFVSYDQLAKSEAYTQTVYICCFIGLAGILSDAGVVDLVTSAFSAALPAAPSVFLVVALLCVLTIFLCNFLPAASVPSVLSLPMITYSVSVGIPPVLVLIPLAMCSNCSWILPLDPIALLTFGRGYYTLQDMVKPGLILTVMTAVITGLWMTAVGVLL